MVKRKFTDSQEREICRRYLAGETTTQLGTLLGTSESTVSNVLKRNNVAARARGGGRERLLTAENEAEICRRYLAGESAVQLGAAFGVDPATVSKYLKRKGITLRTNKEAHGGLSAEIEAEVCKLYKDGKSTSQLGSAFGVHSTTIGNILKRKNIVLRTNKEANRRLTDEREQLICKRYLAGENTYQLAAAFGLTHNPIRKILERHGIERRASGVEFGDSVQHILDCTGRHSIPRECEFYLFELARYGDTHCKPGIAFDTERRADGEYGAEVLRLVFSTRAEAYFLEQAVLDATRGNVDCPADLLAWGGASEIRAMPASDMEPIVLRLAEELEELGPCEFAARYVPMTAAQRAICQQRASLRTNTARFANFAQHRCVGVDPNTKIA